MGTSTNNCSSSANVSVTVLPLPNINASATRSNICQGEPTTLQATGGITYVWSSLGTANLMQGGTITVSPGSSDIFTVTGTDANGCTSNTMVTVVVDPCTYVGESGSLSQLSVHPNPGSGLFVIEGLSAGRHLQVTDVSGRLLLSSDADGGTGTIDLSGYAAGIYYVRTDGPAGLATLRVIKE
jgi:hypothetical protein